MFNQVCAGIHVFNQVCAEIHVFNQVCAGIHVFNEVCAGIHVFNQVCAGICQAEPFDLCACSCMSYLVEYLKPDLCKSRIFHCECQRELALEYSEHSTSRLPEEYSSDMDSDSDNKIP